MKTIKKRITRKQYYDFGGMANSNVFRKERSDGYWSYWQIMN